MIIGAYQNGELFTVSKGEVRAVCMMHAFTPENVQEAQLRYPKNRLRASTTVTLGA